VKYVLLTYTTSPEVFDVDTGPVGPAADTGEVLIGGALADEVFTWTLRRHSAGVVVTDGPAGRGERILVGVRLVDCESVDGATRLAATMIGPTTDVIEVRPLMDSAGDVEFR